MGKSERLLLSSLLVIGLVPGFVARASAAEKRPVPDDIDTDIAKIRIRQIFGREYRARRPKDQLALAQKLLREAPKSLEDGAVGYVLYCDASDLAARAGDCVLAFKIIDEIDTHFVVSPLSLKETALKKATRVAKTPSVFEDLTRVTLQLAAIVFAAEDFHRSLSLAASAKSLSRKAGSKVIADQAAAAKRELTTVSRAHANLKSAFQKVADGSDDRAANSAVGEFRCTFLGQWRAGLALLAKGDDAGWKDLATRDLAGPDVFRDQIQLARSWLKRAQLARGLSRSWLQNRSAYWYLRSLTKSIGTDREKVLGELMEVVKSYSPPALLTVVGGSPPGFVIQRLNGSDLRGWKVNKGKWRPGAGGAIATGSDSNSYLQSEIASKWSYVVMEFTGGNPGLYFRDSLAGTTLQGVNLDEDGGNNGEIRRPIENKRWNQLRIERSESANNYYLNGELVYSSSRFDGAVELRIKSQRGTCQFRKLIAMGYNQTESDESPDIVFE